MRYTVGAGIWSPILFGVPRLSISVQSYTAFTLIQFCSDIGLGTVTICSVNGAELNCASVWFYRECKRFLNCAN